MERRGAASVPAALSRGGSAALWYGLFGGAVAWFTALCVSYFLVTPACSAGTELMLHIVYAVATITGVGAALTGGVLWRGSGAHWPDDGGLRSDRARFIAVAGALLSTLFTLVVLAQWFVAIVQDPCAPNPRLPESPDALVEPRWDLVAAR